MLAIARALMGRPRLLLLDEPSLGLAPLIARQIFDIIRTLNERDGLSVFLVEQNAYHALKLAHRGYVMVNGAITLSGTGRELLAAAGGARGLSRGRAALRPFRLAPVRPALRCITVTVHSIILRYYGDSALNCITNYITVTAYITILR